MNTDEFKNKFAAEEQKQKDIALQMSEQELMFREYENDDRVVAVGDTFFGVDMTNPNAKWGA